MNPSIVRFKPRLEATSFGERVHYPDCPICHERDAVRSIGPMIEDDYAFICRYCGIAWTFPKNAVEPLDHGTFERVTLRPKYCPGPDIGGTSLA